MGGINKARHTMNFSKITDDLFIGTTPSVEDYDGLRDLGVRLVINMRIERMPYKDPHPTPIERLWLPTFDSPLIWIPIRSLMRGASSSRRDTTRWQRWN
jgi:protein tyrosine phosphatase (PTP) superfamily phosphohydrolase (DUF442 family)